MASCHPLPDGIGHADDAQPHQAAGHFAINQVVPVGIGHSQNPLGLPGHALIFGLDFPPIFVGKGQQLVILEVHRAHGQDFQGTAFDGHELSPCRLVVERAHELAVFRAVVDAQHRVLLPEGRPRRCPP